MQGNFKIIQIGSLLNLTFPNLNITSNTKILKSLVEALNVSCIDFAEKYLVLAEELNNSKDFHKVMAQTFHPAEEKNFAPLRSRSGELYAKAILLKNSTPPASANSNRVQEALTRLEKQCLDIHQLVQKPMKDEANKDALLLEKITKAHDIFHEVEGLCHD